MCFGRLVILGVKPRVGGAKTCEKNGMLGGSVAPYCYFSNPFFSLDPPRRRSILLSLRTRPQRKATGRRSWDGHFAGLAGSGGGTDAVSGGSAAESSERAQNSASSTIGAGSAAASESFAVYSGGAGLDAEEVSRGHVGGLASGEGSGGMGVDTAAEAGAVDGEKVVGAVPPPPTEKAPPLPGSDSFASSTDGSTTDGYLLSVGGGGDGRRGGGGGEEGKEGSTLPIEFLSADLSKMFRASQEKVEETLTAGCFFR